MRLSDGNAPFTPEIGTHANEHQPTLSATTPGTASTSGLCCSVGGSVVDANERALFSGSRNVLCAPGFCFGSWTPGDFQMDIHDRTARTTNPQENPVAPPRGAGLFVKRAGGIPGANLHLNFERGDQRIKN